MTTFVVFGQTARASDDFSLEDLPSSSGRLDVLLRCLRAALLISHGLRRDVRIYLVLRGGPKAPRVLRVDGASAKFLRPDERSLATLVKKSLSSASELETLEFVEVRPGIALARGDLSCAIRDADAASIYVLEENGPDVRNVVLEPNAMFCVGDHLGFDAETRQALVALGARPVSLGPVSLHSDDAIALISNELDRRAAMQQ